MPPFCCVGLSCAVFTPVEAPAASSQVALSRLRCASVARVSAALCPLGFCFEAVTRDVTRRAFGSALPGNQCGLCKCQASERRLCAPVCRPRGHQLKNELSSQVPHVIGRRSSLPADKIETLVQAETSVAQTKPSNWHRARPRLVVPSIRNRPTETESRDVAVLWFLSAAPSSA